MHATCGRSQLDIWVGPQVIGGRVTDGGIWVGTLLGQEAGLD